MPKKYKSSELVGADASEGEDDAFVDEEDSADDEATMEAEVRRGLPSIFSWRQLRGWPKFEGQVWAAPRHYLLVLYTFSRMYDKLSFVGTFVGDQSEGCRACGA
jgi:hypothetical protein